MELTSLSRNATGDAYKQIAIIRNYLLQLKEELEIELTNIGYENLNEDLKKRFNSLTNDIQEIASATGDVAQDVSVNHMTRDELDHRYVMQSSLSAILQHYITDTVLSTTLADYITASNLATTLEDYQPLLDSKDLSVDKIAGVTEQGVVTSAVWEEIEPIIGLSIENGVISYTTQKITVLRSGTLGSPTTHILAEGE